MTKEVVALIIAANIATIVKAALIAFLPFRLSGINTKVTYLANVD